MKISTVSSIEQIKAFCRSNLNDKSPFIDYEFYKTLETSQCTNAETGWMPEHIVIKSINKVIGVIPNFRKFNSNGEYVFDHVFINAYNQIGLKYFPKYLSATPFTPVKREKFIFGNKKVDLKVLSELIFELLLIKKIPSFHINFLEQNVSNDLKKLKFLQRIGIQYYWYNRSYKTFECFLTSLKRTKRKNISKERNFLKNQNVSFIVKESDQITLKDIDLFYKCYSNT